MATLILASALHRNAVIRATLPAVYVNGKRRRDLKVLSWEVTGPPLFGRVALLLHSGVQPTRASRMEHAEELPPIGDEILVRPKNLEVAVDFQGIVTAHRLTLDEDGEHLVAEAEHKLSQALSKTIISRWHFVDGNAEELDDVPTRFNADAGGLASASAVSLGGRQTRLFHAAASARRWTVADALAYVIATAVPSGVTVPSLSSLQALAGGTDVGTLEITGLTTAQALERIASRAGLEVRAARHGVGVELYRPGASGRAANVALQRAGKNFSRARSNLWRGHVVIRRRPSRRHVLALGAAKRYESTFTLSPGWDPQLQTSRWRDFVRGLSPNWPLLADVYRKWVLNEHGWYAVAPWNLTTGSFESVSAEDFPIVRPRQLQPCLSCDLNGASLGVAVEVRCGTEAPWLPWRGPLWVSRDECAVYLGGDALPGEFFQAAAETEASVRVTATVEADTRLVAELPGDPAQPIVVVDAAHLARWQKVHEDSVFYDQQDLGPPDERDDTEALTELAEQHAYVVSTALKGELTLGWVDVSCHVGDTVERVKNRAIELRPSPDRLAFIRSVRHDFGPAQCTTLLLEG